MNINELAEAVGETPRQIRYLIAEGFVEAPEGSRAKPDYGQRHLDAINRYQLLRERFKPSQIKALLESERQAGSGGRFALAPGIVLTVDPGALSPGSDPRAIGDLAAAVIENIIKHPKENSDAA